MSRRARVEWRARVRPFLSTRWPESCLDLYVDLYLTSETTHDTSMEERGLRHGRRDCRIGSTPRASGADGERANDWDAKGNRFVPASITIHVGDVVTWTNVSGAHNVVFWPDSVPAGAQTVLQGKMSATMGPLMGPMFAAPNATYTVSFAGLKAGTYKYYCLPHLALGMRAQIVVQP